MARESRIIVQRELLAKAGVCVREALPGSFCAIVTDTTVDALYEDCVELSLQAAGFRTARFAFAAGEESKNIDTYAQVLAFLCEHKCTRQDAVVALGGGVVGDLAGFAAATYLRGVHLVQIPTTLLACVDSSVGGKTAIDLPAGKNLCGAFYQPDLVLCDPSTLSTLPEEIYAAGMAEVLKYAAISDPDIYTLCENDRENLDEIIRRCIDIKREIVRVDERDTGLRQILNFGHTFGHAVEAASGYSVSHGYAVSIGMAIMARACQRRGYCRKEDADRLISALMRKGLPVQTPYLPEILSGYIALDKKRGTDSLVLIEMHDGGKCTIEKRTLALACQMLREGWDA